MKLYAVAIFGFAIQAFGQQAAIPQAWDKEPTTFFGVRFGVPLSQSISECPKSTQYGVTSYDHPVGEPICYELSGPLVKLANIRMMYPVYVEEVSGGVGNITAMLDPDNADAILRALIEKFGEPTRIKTTTVQSGAGASYPKTTASWHGKDISILFESISYRVDEGMLSISNAAYEAKLAADREKKNGDLKDAF